MRRHSARYESYLHSATWRELRAQVLERDGHCCVRCCSINTLQVHHLTYERLYQERLDDLQTLCKPCHQKVHARPKKSTKPKKTAKTTQHPRPTATKRPWRKQKTKKPYAPARVKQVLITENDELHRTLVANRCKREQRAVREMMR